VITRTKLRKNGTVDLTFVLPLDTLDSPVSAVGDFNDWQPGIDEPQPPDIDSETGYRVATASIPTGSTVRFRYLALAEAGSTTRLPMPTNDMAASSPCEPPSDRGPAGEYGP
jgi:hypothetical protein